MDELLFFRGHLSTLIQSYPNVLKNEVDGIGDDMLLSADENDLVDRLVVRLELAVPNLRLKNEWSQETKDTEIDVSGDPRRGYFAMQGEPLLVPAHKFTLTIPFDGDGDLFKLKPSKFTLNPPRGRVSANTLLFSTVVEHIDADAIQGEIDKFVSTVQMFLEWVRVDCEQWNSQLHKIAGTAIRSRKERLLQQDKLGDILGIASKDYDGRTNTYTVPSIRKPKPRSLNVTTGNKEPILSNEDYDYLLDVISSLGSDMEKTPATYTNMEEEHIRDHILSTLATHVKGGSATRETFNKEGKTDILIQVDGKNIFVVECKIWYGEASFQNAIDQTLRYLTWRDTKAVLIVFSKNRDFTKIQSKMSGIVPDHPNYKRTSGKLGESQVTYILRHKDDPRQGNPPNRGCF